MMAFLSKYQEAVEGGARLVLQDLQSVLDSVAADQLDPRVERQAQDFFTPNRCANARAYLLRHVLHDWSNQYCVRILSQISDAMATGYSKLIIHDLVLPEEGVSIYAVVWDWIMATASAGMERSRSQWSELIEKVEGPEIVDYWLGPEGEDADGVVEVVRKLEDCCGRIVILRGP
jgi:hypothetical protein